MAFEKLRAVAELESWVGVKIGPEPEILFLARFKDGMCRVIGLPPRLYVEEAWTYHYPVEILRQRSKVRSANKLLDAYSRKVLSRCHVEGEITLKKIRSYY